MTDPVLAPSFPQQLEEAAKEYAETATENRMLANTAREFRGDPSDYDSWAEDAEKLSAVLTRAAALARAAEKVAKVVRADTRAAGICDICDSDIWHEPHAVDCLWVDWRALVLTEGSDQHG